MASPTPKNSKKKSPALEGRETRIFFFYMAVAGRRRRVTGCAFPLLRRPHPAYLPGTIPFRSGAVLPTRWYPI